MDKHLEDKTTFKVIGIMSGTSLDGLDLAAVNFKLEANKWSFELVASETLPYSEKWQSRLKDAFLLSGEELTQLDVKYGKHIGEQALLFSTKNKFAPDFIASHGHTVFHQPELGYTLQIGSGATMAAVTNMQVINDFRTLDIALGGQGAPLVPIGDQLLFSEYDYCLNLGGFANVSFEREEKRIAFDICPVNFVLNYFAEKQGLAYDKNGELGRKGKVNNELLQELNKIAYYTATPPKSLGREWVESIFFPILMRYSISDLDKLRTSYEHIAIQITRAALGKGKMLVTGGGALNCFLMERLKELAPMQLTVPEKKIIDFKEAIIFAFLGVLRSKNLNNCLASVTGAQRDNCGGVIHMAKYKKNSSC